MVSVQHQSSYRSSYRLNTQNPTYFIILLVHRRVKERLGHMSPSLLRLYLLSACLYRAFDGVGSWGRCFMVCDMFQCQAGPSLTLTPYRQLLSGLNGLGCTPLTLISIRHCPALMGRLTPSGLASHGALLSKGICSLCGEAPHPLKNGLPK